MTFEILDSDSIDFGDKEKPKPKAKPKDLKVPDRKIEESSNPKVSYVTDYKPNGKTRIYEVVVKYLVYNKTSVKVYNSSTIKYPGHEEFFGEQ
jgi:hypothetical protein